PNGSRLTTQVGVLPGSGSRERALRASRPGSTGPPPRSPNGSSSSSNSTGMGGQGTGSPEPGRGWDAQRPMARTSPPAPRPRRDGRDEGAVEEAVDAYEEGDRPIRSGTARAALANEVFRRVFVGAF